MSESLNDKLETFFKSHPYQPVDGKVLAQIAGGYAWRTRVSDLRTQRGMDIVNDVMSLRDADGKPFKISTYTYLPPVETHVEPSGQVAFI
jgi:hypothetical protein